MIVSAQESIAVTHRSDNDTVVTNDYKRFLLSLLSKRIDKLRSGNNGTSIISRTQAPKIKSSNKKQQQEAKKQKPALEKEASDNTLNTYI